VVVAFTLVVLLTFGVGVGAADKVSTPHAERPAQKLDIHLSASFAMAPATFRSTVFVEKHPDNRILRVSVDGENFYRSSDIPLEGTEAPRTHEVLWRDLPAGEYQVSTVLYGSTGTRAVLVRTFTVVGR
jgi:hypothetical protein